MLTGFRHLHGFFADLVIVFLLIAVIISYVGLIRNRPFTKRSKIFSLIALVSVHVQMVIGIAIYFLSPLGISNFSRAMMKHATTRLIGLEHPLAMITAIVLITIGYSKSKRATDGQAKFRHIAIFYSIALALVFLRIPWSYWMSL